MKWNIKTKLAIMGVSAIAAMGILVWLFFSTSDKVHQADAVVEKELVHLDALIELRMAGRELVLAAMDSIVDQLEGKILKERREKMDESLTLFKAENESLIEAAEEAGELGKVADGRALATQILDSVALLEQAATIDLEIALRRRDTAELERLDSVIDDAGNALNIGLRTLQVASEEELRDAMDGIDNEVRDATSLALTVFIFGLVIMSGVMGYLGFSITTPISRLTRVMGNLAGGDTTVEIEGAKRSDEVGDMARAVQVFKDNMIRNVELQEAAEAEQKAQLERGERIESMIGEFDAGITNILGTVSSAATELEQTAQSLSSTAEQASGQAASVATASNQATANVQTVATAAEELSASISEIGRQVNQSAKIAQNAVEETESTSKTVLGLAEAASRIGEVVTLINDIAGQTNLLALNATIEA
ncbi:MAG: HAMP domain-containing protein, partial [Alphaproteobacteria bacterium]|nr:HAMP domain-containing protein [Alphaproteobacteria bacterium]